MKWILFHAANGFDPDDLAHLDIISREMVAALVRRFWELVDRHHDVIILTPRSRVMGPKVPLIQAVMHEFAVHNVDQYVIQTMRETVNCPQDGVAIGEFIKTVPDYKLELFVLPTPFLSGYCEQAYRSAAKYIAGQTIKCRTYRPRVYTKPILRSRLLYALVVRPIDYLAGLSPWTYRAYYRAREKNDAPRATAGTFIRTLRTK